MLLHVFGYLLIPYQEGVPYKQTKRYKKAHARYMRYSRSLTSSGPQLLPASVSMF